MTIYWNDSDNASSGAGTFAAAGGTTILWSSLANGQVISSFDPASDVLRFDDAAISAASVSVDAGSPSSTIFSYGGKTVTLQANPASLTIDNIVFDNGSVLRIGDDTVATTADGAANGLTGTGNHDRLLGLGGDDTLMGGLGNDRLEGGNDNDTLYGNENNDSLSGGNGNDTLYGGAGLDVLDGGAGNDIYRFGRGDGTDYVDQNDGGSGKTDAIVFDAYISPAEVLARRDGDNLALRLTSTGETIWVNHYFYQSTTSNPYKVEQIRFGDGTVWTTFTVRLLVLEGTAASDTLYGFADGHDFMYGYAGDDTLYGDAFNDTLYGGTGNDTLDGGIDNDTLYGNEDNDVLLGGSGADVLYGGAGVDTLDGGAGSDIYRFGRGDGFDHVSQNDAGSGNTDAIVFDAYITPGQVVARASDDNLGLVLSDTGETIWVDHYFYQNDASNPYKVEEIRFGDGTVWDYAAVRARMVASTSGNDTLNGFNDSGDSLNGYEGNDTLKGLAGNDTLYGGTGNDTLDGGKDNDTLYGNEDNDVLLGGYGDDVLYGGAGLDLLDGGAGNDIYRFGRGDGTDYIDHFGTTDTIDTIVFDAYIAPGEIIVRTDGENLAFTLAGTGDTIWVNHYFFRGDPSENYSVDLFRFGDGTVWGYDVIRTRMFEGTSGNDTLYGFNKSGDALNGNDGDDTLYGRNADDTLSGGAGSDTLVGGAGHDQLAGGQGSDRFVYLLINEGADTITDFARGPGGDVLDVSDVLSGYVAGTSDPDAYFRVVESGGATIVNVNADGTGTDFARMAILQGVTGLTLSDMLNDGNLFVG